VGALLGVGFFMYAGFEPKEVVCCRVAKGVFLSPKNLNASRVCRGAFFRLWSLNSSRRPSPRAKWKGIKIMHPTEKTVRQFHESWDMRDPDRGAAVIDVDCEFEDVARGETLQGKDAYKADYHRWREAFPDGLCKVENVMVSQCGEWATVEFRNTGTHTGTLRSSLGDFAPTGKRAEVRYCSVMRVKGGMVVEGRDYYDSATIARQLGLID